MNWSNHYSWAPVLSLQDKQGCFVYFLLLVPQRAICFQGKSQCSIHSITLTWIHTGSALSLISELCLKRSNVHGTLYDCCLILCTVCKCRSVQAHCVCVCVLCLNQVVFTRLLMALKHNDTVSWTHWNISKRNILFFFSPRKHQKCHSFSLKKNVYLYTHTHTQYVHTFSLSAGYSSSDLFIP